MSWTFVSNCGNLKEKKKPQNGLSGILEDTISNRISQCSRFHDLCPIYNFVCVHRAFFPSLMTTIRFLFSSCLQLPSLRYCIRKHCPWNLSSVCQFIKLILYSLIILLYQIKIYAFIIPVFLKIYFIFLMVEC